MSESKWDRIWRERGAAASREPAPFLLRVAGQLPRTGRALDVAGGAGRNAVWLARRGLAVTCADSSAVGLELAAAAAADAGVPLATARCDLEAGGALAALGDPWDLIVCFHFLHRPLLAAIADHLRPGGSFAFVQPTVINLRRHERPGRRFLLEVGELAEILDPRLEIALLDEGWSEEGRHEVELLARRPVSPKLSTGLS